MRSLVQETVRVLEDEDFDIFAYFGSCVDIAAQKKRLKLLVKALENIDSLKPEQAGDLKKLSGFVGGCPLVVGDHSKAERLEDGAVYGRHGVTCLTVETLRGALAGSNPSRTYSQGRMIVEIDSGLLRKARDAKGLSMEALAREVNVSKESIYYYEKGYTRVGYGVARRIEKAVDADIVSERSPFLKPVSVKEKTSDPLASKLMFLDFDVYSFNRLKPGLAAGDEKNRLFIDNKVGADHTREKELSDFFNAFLTVVGEGRKCDVPAIAPSEFAGIHSKKELMDLVREKTA